jgi:hypothetical protein
LEKRRSREDQLSEELKGLSAATEEVPESAPEPVDQETTAPVTSDGNDSAPESEAAAS